MPEYLTPGVYIEEFEIGAKPIEGVSTSTAGFLGVAEMGPSEGLPELVTSFSQFQRIFGGFLPESYQKYRYLPFAVDNFFINGGSRCFVLRVLPPDAVAAKNSSVQTGVVMKLTGDCKSGDKVIPLEFLHGIDTTSKITLEKLRPDGTVEVSDSGLTISSYDRDNRSVTISAGLVNPYPKKSTRVTVTRLAGGASTAAFTLEIEAISKGDWGEDIKIQAIPASQAKTQIKEIIGLPATTKQYKIKNKNGFYKGAIVVYDDGVAKQYRRVTDLNDDMITLSSHLTGDASVVDDQAVPTKTLSTCEFNLNILFKDTMETFSFMSMNPDTPNYFMKVMKNKSNLVTLKSPYATPGDFNNIDPFDMPTNMDFVSDNFWITLANGYNGTLSTLTPTDFFGQDKGPGKRSGIEAFVDIDEVSIIAAPGITDPNIQLALVSHCEKLKDRFAVLDMPVDAQKVKDVEAHRDIFETQFAAVYHPWVQVFDPLEKHDTFIPPSGSIMGIYARSDNERGVHKAPANEAVRNITDIKYKLNKAEQGLLNPKGVNIIRVFPGRGIRVWGARTCTSNTLWKYINVRRLFIFVEESIDKGTQWVVFEPNDEKLWARVRATITQFLTGVWRSGALMGTKAEEAFFVKCDRTTMTQDDIDNGRLICVIGIAPVKPAEFVIFRIAQWAGGASATE